jgi:6-pyruvoyltetrahydropterin/6-carboxytetrahydropterin synthase
MITIAKRFRFEAAHHLPRLPEGHKCRRPHGHSYQVEVRLYGTPDDRGFVVDYADISATWGPLLAELDHRCLNDVPGLEDPTAENLALWIFERLAASSIGPWMSAVRVAETESSWAEIIAEDFKRMRSQ